MKKKINNQIKIRFNEALIMICKKLFKIKYAKFSLQNCFKKCEIIELIVFLHTVTTMNP